MPSPALRRHLFEFNDSSWVPVSLRETIIESLSRAIEWGRLLRRLVAPFRRFLREAASSEVLELCAGAGGPGSLLVRELQRAGLPAPRVLMTDLLPHPERWAGYRAASAGLVDFIDAPVDALAVPRALGEGRARLIINALHHFGPGEASRLLCTAADGSPGLFVAEGFRRSLLGFLPFALAGFPALLANPLLSPTRRLAKVLLTWLSPVSLLASLWDGLVSTQRVYTEAELRMMVAPLGATYEWTFGTYRFRCFGEGTYFYGVRRRLVE